MQAWEVALIYLTPFVAIGLVTARMLKKWARGLDLLHVQVQLGPRRTKRAAFLLGAWREEEPNS